MKDWIKKAEQYLDHCLKPIPSEVNELDWKESLSPNNKKLEHHLSAFANHPGGGFIVFGIENKTGTLIGINKEQSEQITQKLASIGRDSLEPMVVIEHSIVDYNDVPLLFI